jgi:DNA-binding IclR family transcriptional regulator
MANARAFHALTRKSVTRARTLLAQLAEVRRKGYAIDREETRPGMVCIGAPVFGTTTGEAIAAVAVSLPLAVLDARHEALAIATVKRIAAALSQRLGAQRPECLPAEGPGLSRGRRGGRAAPGE